MTWLNGMGLLQEAMPHGAIANVTIGQVQSLVQTQNVSISDAQTQGTANGYSATSFGVMMIFNLLTGLGRYLTVWGCPAIIAWGLQVVAVSNLVWDIVLIFRRLMM